MPTPVVIVDYDAAWPRHFCDIAASLRVLLGDAIRWIDHIGSTAVPRLAAKPMIDVDVTLAGPRDVARACERMAAAGYEARGNRYDDDMWAFVRKVHPACRIYLCQPGNATHRKRLAFRDRLREDAALRESYAALKRMLSHRFALDGDAYTAAKTGFIDAATGWD